MGAGASLPEQVDREAARAYAGEKFDEPAFDAAAQDGRVPRPECSRMIDGTDAEGCSRDAAEAHGARRVRLVAFGPQSYEQRC